MFKTTIYINLINCLPTDSIINPEVENTILEKYNSGSENTNDKKMEPFSHSSNIPKDFIYSGIPNRFINESGYGSRESVYFDASNNFQDDIFTMRDYYTKSSRFGYGNINLYFFSDEEDASETSSKIICPFKEEVPNTLRHIFSMNNNYIEDTSSFYKRICTFGKDLRRLVLEIQVRIRAFKKFKKREKKARKHS